jgi:hypothetical protein
MEALTRELLGPLGLTAAAVLLIWFGGRVLLSIVREYIADVKAARDRWAGIAETSSDGMADLTAAVTLLTASVEALRKQRESAVKDAVEEIVRRLSDQPPGRGVRR